MFGLLYNFYIIMPLAVIPNSLLLPFEALKLGRLVTSIDQPLEGYHERPYATPPTPIAIEFGYTKHDQQSSTGEFGSSITSLFSAAFSKRAINQIRIKPRYFKAYTLDNSDACFDEAVSHEVTRKWVERSAIRGRKIYMIVGICTLTDTQFIQTSSSDQRSQGRATAPVSLSLAAASGVVPLTDLVDSSVHADFASFTSSGTRIFAPGEQICTIKYRKVSYKWLSSRSFENMRLSKTRQWSCMEGDRRDAYEDENGDGDEEDVIEVDIEDAEDLGDEWTVAQSEEGQIYVRS
jgi:hypothetical protein